MSEQVSRSPDLGSAESPQVAASLSGFVTPTQWIAIARALRLSSREADIARCLLDDEREAAIADRLGISSHTVHTHLERVYRKLGVSSRCQLVTRLFAAYVALRQS